MNRILIVYYSLGGNTERVAREIAQRCGADREAIREVRTRSRVLGRLRAAWEALASRSVAIHPASRDPSAYDLVVLGTPVWAGHVTPAVRAYIAGHRQALRRFAFFCTQGGSGAERVFAQMGELCGGEPVDRLVVAERELKGGGHEEHLDAFVAGLERHAGDAPAPGAAADDPLERKAG